MATMRMPSAANAGQSVFVQKLDSRATSAATRSWISERTPWGVSPSGERTAAPATDWRRSPATRTMKNSSRLDEKIEQKRTRSSSGSVSDSASSSTRRLKSSHESSRLRKRSGAGAGSGGRSATAEFPRLADERRLFGAMTETLPLPTSRSGAPGPPARHGRGPASRSGRVQRRLGGAHPPRSAWRGDGEGQQRAGADDEGTDPDRRREAVDEALRRPVAAEAGEDARKDGDAEDAAQLADGVGRARGLSLLL